MISIPQDGILLVHKPVGPTSHDIVAKIRHLTDVKRVGHAGTLDPFAEGLLIVLIGREATKRQSEFLTMDKTYETVIHLGARSATDDCTGKITPASMATPVLPLKVKQVIDGFLGTHEQLPPAFSAKKIKGKKAYELARQGIIPDLTPTRVTIFEIKILEYSWPLLTIRTTVSSGTYIRALARDIGEKLGCGAFCEKLVRSAIGPYILNNSIRV
ncbi:tRNA pseudouridine(55) synthase TruB [Candidatus Uhrbacteria bacterium]|nr:tRNA pseudouridine(55) synthase TruB [Candidatus Uhrbacteria bacterium]